MTRAMRKIVKIDEDKCNGCGLCVPKCAEGAIRIENGKARLAAENLCDGLGACLGHCPQDAITIEERPAEEFSEQAVEQHKHASPAKPQAESKPSGCPGARMRMMNPLPAGGVSAACSGGPARPSMLTHWPVQLALVPPAGPMWQDADVLICADCVPFAFPEFHEKLLRTEDGGARRVAIACPKLDDIQPYIEKLAAIFSRNTIRSITVAHMEVPCCGGIVYAVQQALERARRQDLPVRDITIGIDGTVKA